MNHIKRVFFVFYFCISVFTKETQCDDPTQNTELRLLYSTPIYVANLSEMAVFNKYSNQNHSANAELSAIIRTRWQMFLSDTQNIDDPLFLGEYFHDSHRYNISYVFNEELINCVPENMTLFQPYVTENSVSTNDKLKILKCYAEAASKSIWPELIGSHAWLRLFDPLEGLVFYHLQHFLSLIGLQNHEKDKNHESLLRGLRFNTWATHHTKGLRHGEHQHRGSLFSGVYFVSGDPVTSGELQLYDTRMEQLRRMYETYENKRRATEKILLSPGMLLIWPSYLSHAVQPTYGDIPRQTLPFDIGLRQVDSKMQLLTKATSQMNKSRKSTILFEMASDFFG